MLSLRVRLVAVTGIAVLCGLVVVGVTTFVVVTRSQIQQVDDTLQRAHTPIEQLAESNPDAWKSIPLIAPGLFVAIIDRNGKELFSTPAAEPGREQDVVDTDDIRPDTLRQTVQATDGDDVRLRVDPIRDGGTLVVGQSLHDVNDTRRQLLAVLLIGSTAAIAAALASAWWLVRAGLRPLSRVESSAAAITDSELSAQQVPGAEHTTEVGNLARALNAMLDRLQAASEDRELTMSDLRASETRMRRFVADASHELRTPIAATAAYAELFEHGARDHPADLERAMSGIRSETGRMGELVDDLLLLARLDEHRPLATQRVDLTELVFAAIDAARTVEPGRPFRPRIDDVIMVEGDPLRLRQVIDNLLTNVRTHTSTTTPCEIKLVLDGSWAVLTIADQGPGVAEAELDHLFERFYRIDDARTRTTGGSGLGLSIVDAIVRAHGGSIGATSGEPSGLTVTVRLPVAGPNPVWTGGAE